jgi:hypothetical protein
MMNHTKRHTQNLITREIIATIPDEQLAWILWDHIWLKVGKNYKKLPQVLAAMPVGFRVIYHLFVLDGEIANGGFNQYFFNETDANAEQQSEALRLIGARKHQQVFRRAFKLRKKEKEDEELQRLYAERTLESFSKTYKVTGLGKCDEEWYAMDEEFQRLMTKFIRRNVELFVEREDNRQRKHTH